jgi:hypothetical protein
MALNIPIINYPDFRPYTNITPFTIRDGATYLLQLEALKDWLRDTLVPHVDSEIQELADAWEVSVTELQTIFDQTIASLIEQVDAAVEQITNQVADAEAARDAAIVARNEAEIFASNAQEVQDDALTLILTDTDSDARTALDSLYAKLADFNSVVEILNTGRLSTSTLDTRFNEKADTTVVDGLTTDVADVNTALAGKASKSIEDIVIDGRLSTGFLDGRYAQQSSLDTLEEDVASIDRQGYPVLNTAKKYRTVSGVIRWVNATTWEVVNDAGHGSSGIASITITSTYINIKYNFVPTKVVTFIVTPDEAFAKAAIRVGASVDLSDAFIYCFTGNAGTSPINPATLSAASANFWIYAVFEVA